MKLLYIFLALLFISPVFAQQTSFFDSHKRWNIDFHGLYETYTTIYKFQDTLNINNHIYHSLWFTRDSSLQHFSPAGSIFREDSLGKIYRVYRDYHTKVLQFDKEHMLYDFSLNVADTFYHYRSGSNYIVHAIDSIALRDGTQRKRLLLKSEHDERPNPNLVTWIEGIGGMNGPFFDGITYYNDAASVLRCYFEQEKLKYHHTYFDTDVPSCYSFYKYNEHLDLAERINVYPNPVTSWLEIEGLSNLEQKTELIIVTPIGQEVFRKKMGNAAVARLPIQLEDGLYFYTIKTAKKVIKAGKILFRSGG